MDWIFADDACQKRPSRPGAGPLLALGGLHVSTEDVGPLETALAEHCKTAGIPREQQFKWSPGKKEDFQRSQLTGESRFAFYKTALALAAKHKAKAMVVIVDESCGTASRGAKSSEHDVTTLFLERADHALLSASRSGVVVAATPDGGPKGEGKFLSDCNELLAEGTEYMDLKRLSLGVLTAKSRQLRTLQLADIVVSATVARVAGEPEYSPSVFELIKPLFRRDSGRVGGVGLKIHPDFKYGNLYHWLLGDDMIIKRNMLIPLPHPSLGFFDGPREPPRQS